MDKYPYFIQKINSEKEFIDFQKKLLENGYIWGGDGSSEIWYPENDLVYPIYLSNTTKIDDLKEPKNHFYYDTEIDVFNQKLLRKEKLKKLYR